MIATETSVTSACAGACTSPDTSPIDAVEIIIILAVVGFNSSGYAVGIDCRNAVVGWGASLSVRAGCTVGSSIALVAI